MKKKPKGITLQELFNETGLNRYQLRKGLKELENRGLIKIDRWRGRKTYIDILDQKAFDDFLGEKIEEKKPLEVEKSSESPPRHRPFSWGKDEDWIVIKRG